MLDFLKTHLGQCNQTDVRHDKFYFNFILLLRVHNQVDVSCDKYLINVPPWWSGSSSKIIKVNSYVRHNFI